MSLCFCAQLHKPTTYLQEHICLKGLKSKVCGSKSLVSLCSQIRWLRRWDGAWDGRSLWEFLFRIREETTTMTWGWESVRLNRHILSHSTWWKVDKQRNEHQMGSNVYFTEYKHFNWKLFIVALLTLLWVSVDLENGDNPQDNCLNY